MEYICLNSANSNQKILWCLMQCTATPTQFDVIIDWFRAAFEKIGVPEPVLGLIQTG